jgi:hypothetical protein
MVDVNMSDWVRFVVVLCLIIDHVKSIIKIKRTPDIVVWSVTHLHNIEVFFYSLHFSIPKNITVNRYYVCEIFLIMVFNHFL